MNLRSLAISTALAAAGLLGCDNTTPGDPGEDIRAADTALGQDSSVDAGADTTTPPPQAAIKLTAGTTELTVDPATLSLTLARDGDVLLRFAEDGLELGVVGEYRDTAHYNPYPFKVESILTQRQPLDAWLPLEQIRYTDAATRPLNLTLHFAQSVKANLELDLTTEGRVMATILPPPGQTPKVAYFRLRPTVDSTEAFYGLGEAFDHVNNRGLIRAMQLEVAPLESGTNEAHVPIPFVIGTRGWGLFVENPFPAVFDVAASDDEQLDILFGTGPDSDKGLRFHLFAAEHPLDITRHYYDVTAYPLLPARWALGPWIWRDENRDQAQVLDDIQQIRDLDLATSGVWIDRPYATAVNTFDFKASQFPDPQAMIDAMHAKGLRVALWHTPYLDAEKVETAAQRAEAEANGYYPPVTGGLFNKWGRPIDLTQPAAAAWWQAQVRRYTDMGIEGFKLDYGEDIAPGSLGVRNRWLFANGEDERSMHSQFQRFYHRLYAETLPETGGFLLCRGGTYGDQANVSVIWPGDLDADFSRHGEQVGNYKAVGGLPASMVAGLSLGPSGFPFYGSDTGGYRHSPPDKETFVRWFEQTALSTVMQVGTSSNDVAWEPTPENGFDAEVLDLYRVYARLHMRLFPYTWTYAQALRETGHPIARPFGLMHPELGVHPWDQYFYGSSLLVAPIVERDARSRSVLFPPGLWFDWWTGEHIIGVGSILTVAAPLGTLPLYLKAGALLPMLRPTIDTLAGATEASVDSFVTDGPGRLYVRVAPGPEPSSFTLYDGTELTQADQITSLTLSYAGGSEFSSGARFEVLDVERGRPAAVAVDGTTIAESTTLDALDAVESGWFYDGSSLVVQVGGGTHTVTVTPGS